MTREMTISHVYSFFLFVCLLYRLPAFLERPGLRNGLLLGLFLGWILVVRPTNAIAFLLLLGYHVYSWNDLRVRIRFFFRHWRPVTGMSTMALAMVFPQMLYWKEMTGRWIYYSYSREGFWYYAHPKVPEVLFDVQNGLFLYSPLVLMMVLGIFIGIRYRQYHGPVLLLIFAIATYTFASWWTWWFGGAFGHRCYVEYYALLAIPLAGLYQRVWEGNKGWKRAGLVILTILLMVYSVRLSYLNTALPGPWDGKEWRWNWEKYAWIMRHFFWPDGLY